MARSSSKPTSTGQRLGIAALVGLVGAGLSLWFQAGLMSILIGWDVAAVVYLVSVALTVRSMSSSQTASHAVREDPTAPIGDVILLVASIASIIGEGVVAIGSKSSGVQIIVALLSVVLSWFIVHTTFMLRYGRLYYSGKDGGIDFNQPEPPTYRDFAYLAFTVGMTYQVSDTEISSSAIRNTILRQALISYLFGAVILASTVNVIAGLSQ